MDYTAVEWIALVFVVLGLIKLITMAVNKKAWLNHVSKRVYGGGGVSGFIFVVLAIVVFYFLIQEMSVVSIFAVMAFTSLIFAVAFMSFSKELEHLIKVVANKKFDGWMWLYVIIWLILSGWVLYEIFLG